MKCLTCRGACCEDMELQIQPMDIFAAEWLAARGEVLKTFLGPQPGAPKPILLRLECRCPKLTPDGLCGIYEERPAECSAAEAGAQFCLDAVKRRRTRLEYEQIRDENDPPAEAIYGPEPLRAQIMAALKTALEAKK